MNNKKIITATLLISDGSIEHEYFHELLGIEIDELLNLGHKKVCYVADALS